MKILRDTLVHLRTIDNYLFDNVLPIEQLLKTGLMYEIMKTISRIVPYHYDLCDRDIYYNDSNHTIMHVGSGLAVVMTSRNYPLISYVHAV